SAAYRFYKFARRHRAALTSGCLVAFALIVGTGVSAWQAVRATHAESQAKAHEGRARRATLAEAEQRRLTNLNLQKAIHALHRTYLRVAERLPEKVEPGSNDRELLEEILKFYEDFVRQNVGNPAIQSEHIRVYFRIAQVYKKLGHLPQAEAAL